MQDNALPLVDSLQIVNEINELLECIFMQSLVACFQRQMSPKSTLIYSGLWREVEAIKDAGFTRLKQICDGTSSKPSSAFRDYFMDANITSVDVEKSFSQYKNILSPRRTSLRETTIEPYLMLIIRVQSSARGRTASLALDSYFGDVELNPLSSKVRTKGSKLGTTAPNSGARQLRTPNNEPVLREPVPRTNDQYQGP
ncbi:hypothetical protein NQ318_013234 [Aromia moschata]|uniref:HAT C-terminal dimerisation domain-containing protein n=1 Tax=Aromia moschata TaxID=1265417 RepID=A0AAV8YBB1_9CUCU|nr:hypothetical protein NQ318_013234 [Aromia moschata]